MPSRGIFKPSAVDNVRRPAMNLSEFVRSRSSSSPPAGLAPTLEALWWAAKDDWQRAHKLVQVGNAGNLLGG